MTISDEQIEAIKARADSREKADFHFAWTQPTNYVEAQCDVFALLRLIKERDASIAELRNKLDAIGDKGWREYAEWVEEEWHSSLAELRKPVAVERNQAVERIRNACDRSSDAYGREVLMPRWRHVFDLLSAYDALAQQCAGYANAHVILLGERNAAREEFVGIAGYLKEGESPAQCIARNRNDVGIALGHLSRVTGERDASKESERQLREALQKLVRSYVNLLEGGRDRILMLGGTCDAVDVMEQADIYLRQARAALAASPAPVQKPFQERCADWYRECFRREPHVELATRCHRFVEESLELAQACGVSATEVGQLVEYVYGRPVGERIQEIGGALMTLAILCESHGLDMIGCSEIELQSAIARIEQIRAKDAAKPAFSTLPGTIQPAPVQSEKPHDPMDCGQCWLSHGDANGPL